MGSVSFHRPLSAEGYSGLAFVVSFLARVLTIPARQIIQVLPQAGDALFLFIYVFNSVLWASAFVILYGIFKANRQ